MCIDNIIQFSKPDTRFSLKKKKITILVLHKINHHQNCYPQTSFLCHPPQNQSSSELLSSDILPMSSCTTLSCMYVADNSSYKNQVKNIHHWHVKMYAQVSLHVRRRVVYMIASQNKS